MPEDQVCSDLEKGGKCLGYYQNGIDIDHEHDDGSIGHNIGIFCGKAHIVSGKIPPKYEGGQWLFVKAEHFGTQRVADSINHTLQLGKSLAGASKGPKHLRGPKRVENTDKKKVKSFCALVDACSQKPIAMRYLPSCYLTPSEMHERAKWIGMSFMYPKVQEIRRNIERHQRLSEDLVTAYSGGGERPDARELDQKAAELSSLVRLQAVAWLTSVDEDPACDYVETRTGGEVIIGLKELGLEGRQELPDARAEHVRGEEARMEALEAVWRSEEGGGYAGANAEAGITLGDRDDEHEKLLQEKDKAHAAAMAAKQAELTAALAMNRDLSCQLGEGSELPKKGESDMKKLNANIGKDGQAFGKCEKDEAQREENAAERRADLLVVTELEQKLRNEQQKSVQLQQYVRRLEEKMQLLQQHSREDITTLQHALDAAEAAFVQAVNGGLRQQHPQEVAASFLGAGGGHP
jgi:hypothetical protein